MKHQILFILLFLTHAALGASNNVDKIWEQAKKENWAASPEWASLLHMRKTILGLRRSGITDKGFFLAANGHKNSEDELRATIIAFLDPSPTEDDARCRYPARLKWLKEKKGLVIDDTSCPRYESWREKLAPEGLSMIFAAYYFNNPASMYGHTFLKVNRIGYENTDGLLDYTVNYAAVTNTSNGLLFAARGLLGLYKGRYSTDPFYIKIQKYNNIESRDLWEYQLNLSSDQLDTLVKHLWEVGPYGSPYFFFNRNCSYELLPLLEAAAPTNTWSSQFMIRALPVDTLRTVVETPGILKEVHKRPSHLNQLRSRYGSLTKNERSLARRFSKGTPVDDVSQWASMSPLRKANTIDVALDLWRTKNGFSRTLPEKQKVIEHQLLTLRKDLPSNEQKIQISQETPPHEAHKSFFLMSAFGSSKQHEFWDLHLRPALHDLNSSAQGYIAGSELEMFHTRLRWQPDDGRLLLKDLKLISILALSPWDSFSKPPSWGVRASVGTLDDWTPIQNRAASFSGETGLSVKLPGHRFALLSVMIGADASAGHFLHKGHRIAPLTKTGLFIEWSNRSRLNANASVYRYVTGHIGNRVRLDATQTIDITQDTELRLNILRDNHNTEGRIGIALHR